jgi:hypothetical protein
MAVIRRGKIQTFDNNNKSKVIVIVGEDNEENAVNTVAVKIPTIEGQPFPSPNNMVLELKSENENGTKRFVFKELIFSSNPVSFTYEMTATMKDVNNNQVGDPLTINVKVTEGE